MANKVFGTDFTNETNPLGTETVSINNGTTLEDVTLRDFIYQTIANAPEEASVHDDDNLGLLDSQNSNAPRRVEFSTIWTWISGKILSNIKYSEIIGGNAGASPTIGSGATGNLALFAGFISVGANAPLPKGGTLKNLKVRIFTAQPASGTLVFDVMVNNVASGITATLAAGLGGAGVTLSDSVNSVVVNAGDLVYIRVTNNATATSASVGIFSLELEQSVT